MKERSAKIEQEQNAPANKPDTSASTPDPECVSESGGDENPTYLFSRELAVALNPKRPDFNASLVLYGLYLRQIQKIRPFGYRPKINRERACYASLSELHAQYPWLTEEGIRKLLWRAHEVADGEFILDDKNSGAIGGKLHFWLSPALIKEYKFAGTKASLPEAARGLVGVKKLDALRYGVLEGALLFNLQYVTGTTRNVDPVVDGQGRIYRELSPSALTKPRKQLDGSTKPPIFPVCRKRMSEAVGNLKALQGVVEHADRSHFFRLPVDGEFDNATVTKVAEAVTKVADPVTTVAGQAADMGAKCRDNRDLYKFWESSYTNTSNNPYRKCVFPSSVSRCSTEDGEACGISPGARTLNDLITSHLIQHRQKDAVLPSRSTLEAHKAFRAVDHDTKKFIGYDLHYDFIGLEWYSGRPYCRTAEIDHYVEEMVMAIHLHELPCKPADVAKLRQLFASHPMLTADHLLYVINHTPWDILGEYIPVPKKGHDWWFWARKRTSVKLFLRYLPQFIREAYVFDAYGIAPTETIYSLADDGRPIFSFADMNAPLLEVAFENESAIPVTHVFGENEDGDWVERPIYYAEFVGLPGEEFVTHDRNPMCLEQSEVAR